MSKSKPYATNTSFSVNLIYILRFYNSLSLQHTISYTKFANTYVGFISKERRRVGDDMIFCSKITNILDLQG